MAEPSDVLKSMRNALDSIDAAFPPAPVTPDLEREARTFYELALMTLMRRGCIGAPFGNRWDSMTNSAKAIWIEAMAQWRADDVPAGTAREGDDDGSTN